MTTLCVGIKIDCTVARPRAFTIQVDQAESTGIACSDRFPKSVVTISVASLIYILVGTVGIQIQPCLSAFNLIVTRRTCRGGEGKQVEVSMIVTGSHSIISNTSGIQIII